VTKATFDIFFYITEAFHPTIFLSNFPPLVVAVGEIHAAMLNLSLVTFFCGVGSCDGKRCSIYLNMAKPSLKLDSIFRWGLAWEWVLLSHHGKAFF